MIGSRPVDAAAPDRPPAGALAAATFLRDHPERIRSLARRLQDAERLLDSVVGGRSMGDQLPDGAPVRIQLARREVYERGEIVAFWSGGRVNVHRVLFCGRGGRRRGVVITRGDAFLCPDLPFDVSSVLGTVVAVRTGRGWNPPEALPRRALAGRAVARSWQAIASALCWADLALARRGLGWLYSCGRAAIAPLRRAH